jgi:hypothetical protein
MREKVAHGAKAEMSQKRIEMERRILKSKIIFILKKRTIFDVSSIL